MLPVCYANGYLVRVLRLVRLSSIRLSTSGTLWCDPESLSCIFWARSNFTTFSLGKPLWVRSRPLRLDFRHPTQRPLAADHEHSYSVSYHIERYYRRRREIARLYKPLSGDMEAYASEDEDGNSTPPRPAPPLLQQQAHSPGGQQPTDATTIKSTTGIGKMPAFKNVWDDRVENVFDVGDEDSEDDAWPTSGSKGK